LPKGVIVMRALINLENAQEKLEKAQVYGFFELFLVSVS
jgi:hypothetical protein